MYCSHCGKRVTDTMLFCPFCGEPIVIPDQDDGVADLAEPAMHAEAEPGRGAPFAPENDVPRDAPDSEPAEAEAAEEPVEASASQDPGGQPGVEPPSSPSDAAAELLNWDVDRRVYADVEPVDEAAETPFSPLLLDQEEPESVDWRSDIARRKQEAAPERKPPQTQRAESQTAHLDGRAPRLEESKGQDVQSHRAANTFVPPKALDPNDLFMDAKQDDYDHYDDYDAYDAEDNYDDDDDGYVYEDEEQGSFFMRHIRGIVGATLFAVLVLLFVIYICSNSGQAALAKANLAWKVDVYSALGFQSYQDQRYDEAGLYYERALARDPDNYSYASSAAMAYVTGNNIQKAASMLKKCIEISPKNVEPYVYLLNLYPEVSGRPWDITQLIQKGYEVTGDSRLASVN